MIAPVEQSLKAGVLLLVRQTAQGAEILGVYRSTSDRFGLPGGKYEPKDQNSTRRTAIREMYEETGIEGEFTFDTRFVLSRMFGRRQVDYYLTQASPEVEQAISEVMDGYTLRWFTPQDYLEQTPFPEDDEIALASARLL